MLPETGTERLPLREATSAAGDGSDRAGAGPDRAPTTSVRPSLAVRMLKAFAMFWWDFLVGDTPELFVGVMVIVGIVLALVKAASSNSVAVVVFPGLVVLLLTGSVIQAKRSQR